MNVQAQGSAQSGRLVLAAALGCLHALSFAPDPLPAWALPFVQVFTLAALFVQLQRSPGWRALLGRAFAFGMGNYGLGLYWLYHSMHHYGGMSAAPAAAGVLALAAYLSLYACLAALAAQALSRWPADGRGFAGRQPLVDSIVWASAWTLAEWLRGTLLTGFPWLNIGYAHVEGVLAPWAPLLGVYGLAWLAAFASAAIAAMVRYTGPDNDARAAGAVGVALLIGLAGIALGHQRWTSPQGDPLVIRLVQGNVPQSEKFDPERIGQGIAQYLNLADLAPKAVDGKPDVIVLPETVLPMFQSQVPDSLWQQLLELAARHQAVIVMGLPLSGPQAGRYTNSAIAFDAGTPVTTLSGALTPMRYDKQHLVPFGEFVPTGFRWFVDAMRIPLGDFSRGSARQPLFAIGGQHLSPDICYEDVFGEEIIHTVRDSAQHGPGASVLINLSNLAWFGDSWALRQHLQISRMRALETGRPMLRATNTGVTAAITPGGHVGAMLKTQQPGVLDVEVQGMQGLTPYVRWGNGPVLLASLFILGLRTTRRKRSTS